MNVSSKYLWPVAAVVIGGIAAWLAQPPTRTNSAVFSALSAAPRQDQATTHDRLLGPSTNEDEMPRLPPGHPDITVGSVPSGQNVPAIEPHAVMRQSTLNPHGSPSSGGDSVPVGKVERASGGLGYTVSELVNGRKKFAGQRVRVRGVVVKSTSGVLGRTFVHVRDGSGNAASSDHDLTITTEEVIPVGTELLFEGIVVTDKDFGVGYSYPILIEDARTVSD